MTQAELKRLIREQKADDATDVCQPEVIRDPRAKRSNKSFAVIKNFTSCGIKHNLKWDIESREPTPDQIAIAKIDGICPICDKNIDVYDGALCQCGFSF